MVVALWALVGFLLGSIPFSFIIGKLFLRIDIRTTGDGNPGSTNVWVAGGWKVGLFAGVLDFLKGVVPVGIALYSIGISDWGLIPVALSPIAGHAFTPFLKFKGGKAIAVSYGVWMALTKLEAPILLILCVLLFRKIQNSYVWALIAAMLCLLFYIFLRYGSVYFLVICCGNLLILIYKHRYELRKPVKLTPLVTNLFKKRG